MQSLATMSLFTSPVAASPAMHEVMRRYHSRHKAPGQCGSANVQYVAAPLPVVWSLLRRFDRPQDYKRFLKGCRLRAGDGRVGSVREVTLVSGLPAGTSTERHVISFSVVGGDHRLSNYQSTTSLHEGGGGEGTVVVESYVVDVPPGKDTCVFVDIDTIIRCNLISHTTYLRGRTPVSSSTPSSEVYDFLQQIRGFPSTE